MTPDGPFILDFLCAENPADLDGDQSVTLDDFFGLLSQVGQQGQEHIPGDLDGDGAVTQTDVTLLLEALATTYWSAWVDVLNTLIETHPEFVIETDAGLLPNRPCLDPYGDFFFCGGGGGGGEPGGPGGNGSGEGGQPNPGGGGTSMPGGRGPPSGGGSGGGTAPCCEWEVQIVAPTMHQENGQWVRDPAANYMPVYGRMSFTVDWTLTTPGCRNDWASCCPNGATGAVGWRWVSGQNLIKPGGNPWAFESNGTPGTITVQFWFRPCTGGMISDQHSIVVKQYDELDIRYAAFIECSIIEGPVEWEGFLGYWPFFGGDGRGLNPATPTYRALLNYALRVSDFQGVPNEMPLTNIGPPFGQTTGYGSTGASVNATLPAWQCRATPSGVPFADACTLVRSDSNHVIRWQRLTPDKVVVRFNLTAADCLVLIAPSLRAYISLELKQLIAPDTGAQSCQYRMSGFRTRYPSHEVYVAGHAITTLSHLAMQTTPLDLTLSDFWLPDNVPLTGEFQTSP